MLCGMFFEMLGIGMVMPALAFMVQDSNALASPAVRTFLAWIGNPSQSQLVLGGLTALLAIYIVKSLFLVAMAYCQSRFVAALQTSMNRRLFSMYMAQPWAFHLDRNSAELIRNVDSIQLFAITCTSLLTLVAELLVVVGIIILLVWVEPTGALLVGIVLGVSAYFYDSITRNRIAQWGHRRTIHHGLLLKHLQEGLCGAKDIKVLGCESSVLDHFMIDAHGLASMNARQQLFQQIPRLWYELLAVTALCMLTAVMIWQGKPLAGFVPILGLFGTAAFRLLPSVNRLAVSAQQIRYSKSLTDALYQEFQLRSALPQTMRGVSLPFIESICLDHVTYRYSSSPRDTVSDICISIRHGSSIGIIGGSGAGKSTLVDILLGLLSPTLGRVLVDGVDIQSDARAWLNNIGYVPQSIFLSDDTLRRNIAFGLPDEQIDDVAVSRAVKAAQLESFVATLDAGLDTYVGERGVRLSGGQRQRIGIARSLYYDPAVLVLDEATSALDTHTEKEVMAAVNSLHGKKTIIIVAHRLTTVSECDVLYRLEKGRLVQSGSYKEVIEQAH
jgi:ABC-type multidrug transport system fused ATPase/permease subunit